MIWGKGPFSTPHGSFMGEYKSSVQVSICGEIATVASCRPSG